MRLCQLGPKARERSRRPWAGVGPELVRCSAVAALSVRPGVEVNGHVQAVRGQGGRGDVSPLDYGRRPFLQQFRDGEVDNLLELLEPPDIGVQELPAGAVL